MTLGIMIIIAVLLVLGVGYLIFWLMRRSQTVVPQVTDEDARAATTSSGSTSRGARSRRRRSLPEPARDDARVREPAAGRDPRPGPRSSRSADDEADRRVGTTEWIVVIARRRRTADPSAAHPVLPGAGAAGVPDPRLGRPDHLPAVPRHPAGRLPVLRQGARRLLPLGRLPLHAAQLDQPGRVPHGAVPLLLPHDRRDRLRAHAEPDHPVHLPEHLRVLLPLRRGSSASAGTPAA